MTWQTCPPAPLGRTEVSARQVAKRRRKDHTMSEARWLACNAPEGLLHFLKERASPRKLRLAACAFYRRVWSLLEADEQAAVDCAERFADGALEREALVGLKTHATRVENRKERADYPDG